MAKRGKAAAAHQASGTHNATGVTFTTTFTAGGSTHTVTTECAAGGTTTATVAQCAKKHVAAVRALQQAYQ